jgi:RNA-binding protein
MPQLKSSQRKWLRGLAHPLEPIVRIGKHGATEGVLSEIDAALDIHELVKVQAPIPREEKADLSTHLEAELNAQVVGRIGHIFILYREQSDPEKRKIHLPE